MDHQQKFDRKNPQHLSYVCRHYYAPEIVEKFLKAQFLIGRLDDTSTFEDVFVYIEKEMSFENPYGEGEESPSLYEQLMKKRLN